MSSRPGDSTTPRSVLLIALLLGAAGLATPAAAESFVYAGDHAFPPHEYLDEAGRPAGFNVDVVRLLARESGWDVEIRLGPWDEQLRSFASGEADVMSLAWSEQRAEQYAFLVQIWTLRQGLLFRPGRAHYPDSLDALGEEVVAVERGGGVHERLLALPAGRRPVIRAVGSHRDACILLRNGEVTAVVGGQLTLAYYASRVGLGEHVEIEANSFGYFLATTPDKAERFAFLTRTFEMLQGTDALNRLTERAFALPGPEPGPPWRELLPWGLGVGVVVGLVVLWNRTLKAQVELRTRELRESERQRRQSEKLAALGNVVGAVAHEVRNPLFAISANVDVLEARLGDAEENVRNLESLRSSVDRLSQLMHDLLDYGRTDGDGLERSDALRPALEEALALAVPLAEQKRVRLQTSICESPPLDIDAPRLTRAVRNLMENAIQHSPEDGTVQLIAERAEPGWLEIRVEDTGPGFPPESAGRLFEPFFTLRRGGTGLGLAIVERVAAAHGATVGAAIREGGGAAVWIRLPVPPEGASGQTSTP